MFDYIYSDSLIDFEEGNKCEGCLLARLCKSDITVLGMDNCRNKIGEDNGLYCETGWTEMNSQNRFWKKTDHWDDKNFEKSDWDVYLEIG